MPTPKQVDPKRLYKNNKLFSDNKIEEITEFLENYPIGRYSKTELHTPYGIIKGRNGIYAIYNEHDEKEEKQIELGRGAFGATKLVQNLLTGEWFVLKTVLENGENELDILWDLERAPEPDVFSRHSLKHLHNKENFLMKYAPGETLDTIQNCLSRGNLELSPQRRLDLAMSLLIDYKKIFDLGYVHGKVFRGQVLLLSISL